MAVAFMKEGEEPLEVERNLVRHCLGAYSADGELEIVRHPGSQRVWQVRAT
jgi:hypothetical protein